MNDQNTMRTVYILQWSTIRGHCICNIVSTTREKITGSSTQADRIAIKICVFRFFVEWCKFWFDFVKLYRRRRSRPNSGNYSRISNGQRKTRKMHNARYRIVELKKHPRVSIYSVDFTLKMFKFLYTVPTTIEDTHCHRAQSLAQVKTIIYDCAQTFDSSENVPKLHVMYT